MCEGLVSKRKGSKFERLAGLRAERDKIFEMARHSQISDETSRKLVREIVTSSAYRQSSKVTPELLQRDPENRLLARGPRFRLQAEFLRPFIDNSKRRDLRSYVDVCCATYVKNRKCALRTILNSMCAHLGPP